MRPPAAAHPRPPAPLADDPRLLLALALAGGGSLEVDRTCTEFLRALIASGRAEVAAIWRVEELPAPGPARAPSRPEVGWRTHVLPDGIEPNPDTPDINEMLSRRGTGEGRIAPGRDAHFRLPDAGRGEAAILVLPLSEVGVLELAWRDRAAAAADLETLRPLARQLAAAIRAGLAWEALRRRDVTGAAAAEAGRERLRREIASEIRHALRNTLTGVQGFAELLLQRDFPEPKRRELLALLHREARRLDEILEGHRRAAG
jgi:signal transduction histidine kinase